MRDVAGRYKLIVVLGALIFLVANTFNALNKGGDATDFFEGGRRILKGEDLYAGSSPASGFIGPPFQATFFAPFAAIATASETAARLLWYAVNIVCLGLGMWCWTIAWRSRAPDSRRISFEEAAPWMAALAILLPLQTNFEHQNMNPLLLALIGGSALALSRGRGTTAGALIGIAAAIKVLPGLLILYFAVRRLWRPTTVAILTATVLTTVPVLVYGPEEFGALAVRWLEVGTGGWPTRGANQSLIAAVDRMVGDTLPSVHAPADAPLPIAIFLVLSLALALAASPILLVRPGVRTLVAEMAAVTTLAVLLSPIAWDHYWVLLFPAFLVVYTASAPGMLGRSAMAAYWLAAVLTTGLSRLTVGRAGWSTAREWSADTIAALILYLMVLSVAQRLSQGDARPVPDRS